MMRQIDTYITWVNRQLENHPKRRLVTDLQNDMRDGVVFLQLIEVIGGVDQMIHYDLPLSICDMRANINRVIEFLSNNNVRVHHILPKEIIEGKLKSIMRLVLAIAAHFKSDTITSQSLINQSFPGASKRKLERTSSLVSILANAAATLADASRNASGVSLNYRSDRNHTQLCTTVNPRLSSSSATSISVLDESTKINKKIDKDVISPTSSAVSIPSTSFHREVVQNLTNIFKENEPSEIHSNFLNVDDEPSLRNSSTPKKSSGRISSVHSSNQDMSITNKSLSPLSSSMSIFDNSIVYKTNSFNVDSEPTLDSSVNINVEQRVNEYDCHCEETIGSHEEMLDDVVITKSTLLELQNLLCKGQTAEEEESGPYSPYIDDSFEEQLILRTLMLEQKDEECSHLKFELNELKEINTQWSGEKVALQTRLSQQEQVILALKFKLLQHEISSKNKNEEELDSMVEEHQKQMQQLCGEVATKNDIIHKQKQELAELSIELQANSQSEASLQSKLETQESKVSSLQKQLKEVSGRMYSLTFAEKVHGEASIGDISGKLNEAKFHRDTQKILREHKNMCTTLCNIRQRFKAEDPAQHAFESMEQSMSSLVDTLSMMETTVQTKESHNRMVSRPKICTGNMSPSIHNHDSSYDNHTPSPDPSNSDPRFSERLKVIYYLGKSTTPVLKISDMSVGSFTLRDFKKAVNRPGRYRYFFKSNDKDFGYVREELLFDDDIVPGDNNKVVAWLERSVTDL